MSEYISREAVCKALNSEGYPKNMRVHKKVLNIQAADVVEVRHGRWERLNWGFEYDRCSVCGYEHRYAEQFVCCPSCGAKMDGGQEPPKEETPTGPYDLLYEEGGPDA